MFFSFLVEVSKQKEKEEGGKTEEKIGSAERKDGRRLGTEDLVRGGTSGIP